MDMEEKKHREKKMTKYGEYGKRNWNEDKSSYFDKGLKHSWVFVQ